MQSKRRRRRGAAEWSRLVESWRTSGESAARFAAEHGVGVSSLYWWDSKLAAAPGPRRKVERSRKLASGPRQFAEVVVRPPVTGESAMEVVTPSGHRVRVRGVVDAAALRTVLEVLHTC